MTTEKSALAPDHPMNRLRRIAAALAEAVQLNRAGELADDFCWLTDGIARHDEGAAHGIDLTRALGLSGPAGARKWWRIEAQHQRDARLRATHKLFFADMGLKAAAAEIVATTKRLARQSRAPETGPAALIHDAQRFLPIPQTTKQVQAILEMK